MATTSQNINIIVPTLNEETVISSVVSNLISCIPENHEYNLYIVDGGSTDSTIKQVETLQAKNQRIHLLHNEKKYQSAAVNVAVSALRDTETIFFRCDAHAFYPKNFFSDILKTMAEHDVTSVVVPMDSVGATCLQKAIAWTSNSPIGTGGSSHRGGLTSGYVDHGHHAAMKVSEFRAVGGYDESYTHNEDAELDCRLIATGGKVYLNADVRLVYHPRKTLSALARQYFNYGRGRSRTVRRHKKTMRLRQMAAPVNFVLCLMALPLSFISPVFLLWHLLYLGALATASLKLTLEHKSPCALLSGLAAFVMHNAWAWGFITGFFSILETPWTAPRRAEVS